MSKPLDRLPPLDLLASFEAVARRASITRAAQERFVTQGAMSRQIQALEEELGAPLFERRHRSLALTPVGQKLLATVSPLLAQLRETVLQIRAPQQREVLALTTTPGFASLWLIPRLAGFTAEHPGIDVRLDAAYERRDLVRDGFDLAVRYGDVADAVGAPMFDERIVPVCAPALLKRPHPPLRTPVDLAGHTMLQMLPERHGAGMPVDWDSWLRAVGAAALRPAAVLSFSTYHETIAAAQAGQGVALGRRPLVDALLRRRELVVPFGDPRASGKGFQVVLNPAARERPAVRALSDWLLAEARRA